MSEQTESPASEMEQEAAAVIDFGDDAVIATLIEIVRAGVCAGVKDAYREMAEEDEAGDEWLPLRALGKPERWRNSRTGEVREGPKP